ncbi:MAG: hypothetical protein ACK4K7_08200 [Allosphingosinicella sp.]|uniref:hypothetical protein n=1 Tax=Allosphingosinicella sp. TaxID=2823234 RepID=UPI00394CDBA2
MEVRCARPLSSSPALSVAAVPVFAGQGNGSEEANERRICKTLVKVGTRLNGRRYCLTRNEWDQVAWEARRVTGEIVDRAMSQGGAPKTKSGGN